MLTYDALYLRQEYKKKGNACMHHGPSFSAQASGPRGRGGGGHPTLLGFWVSSEGLRFLLPFMVFFFWRALVQLQVVA